MSFVYLSDGFCVSLWCLLCILLMAYDPLFMTSVYLYDFLCSLSDVFCVFFWWFLNPLVSPLFISLISFVFSLMSSVYPSGGFSVSLWCLLCIFLMASEPYFMSSVYLSSFFVLSLMCSEYFSGGFFVYLWCILCIFLMTYVSIYYVFCVSFWWILNHLASPLCTSLIKKNIFDVFVYLSDVCLCLPLISYVSFSDILWVFLLSVSLLCLLCVSLMSSPFLSDAVCVSLISSVSLFYVFRSHSDVFCVSLWCMFCLSLMSPAPSLMSLLYSSAHHCSPK